MKTTTNLQETKTFDLYQLLKAKGFNVTFNSLFDYEYNKDYNVLVICVRDAENKITQLYDVCKRRNFNISIESSLDQTYFMVRRPRALAELVKHEALDYKILEFKENTPQENTCVISFENWKSGYNFIKSTEKKVVFLQKELTDNPNVWIYLCKKNNAKTLHICAELNFLFPKFHTDLHEQEDDTTAFYCMNIQPEQK